MKVVGRVTTIAVAAGMLGGIILGVRSIGDVRRYIKMSRM